MGLYALNSRLEAIKAKPITRGTPVHEGLQTCVETQQLMLDTIEFLLNEKAAEKQAAEDRIYAMARIDAKRQR